MFSFYSFLYETSFSVPLAGRLQQGFLLRSRNHQVPSPHPRHRGPSARLLRQGHGLPLPLGAHPPQESAPASLREGLRPLQQHGGLQERLPEDHQADNKGIGEEHVDTLDETGLRARNAAGDLAQGRGRGQPDPGQAEQAADGGDAGLAHPREGEEAQGLAEALGGEHRLRQHKSGRGRTDRGKLQVEEQDRRGRCR